MDLQRHSVDCILDLCVAEMIVVGMVISIGQKIEIGLGLQE